MDLQQERYAEVIFLSGRQKVLINGPRTVVEYLRSILGAGSRDGMMLEGDKAIFSTLDVRKMSEK